MFLSIIIPVYNAEKYIRECIESCISQDLPQTEYEIICIDDDSTDSSYSILCEYKIKYSNVQIIKFSENRGVSAARNAGLDYMSGQYCMFLDGDDFIIENCFRKFKYLLSKSSPKTVLCFGRYNFWDKGYKDRLECFNSGVYYGCPSDLYITNQIIPSNIVSNVRFQENIVYGEDELFSFEIKLLKPDYLFYDEPVYYYRMHNESAMQLNAEKSIIRVDSVINSAIHVREKYGLESKTIVSFFNNRITIAIDQIAKLSLKHRIRFIRVLIKNNLIVNKRLWGQYVNLYLNRRLSTIKGFILMHLPMVKCIIKKLHKNST